MFLTPKRNNQSHCPKSNEENNGQDIKRLNRQRRRILLRSKESNGKQGRLWQLPQSSIQEYAAWIEDKPKEEQTPAEQRFVQKFQRRMLMMIPTQQQKSPPTESMKQYIARLEAKDNKSDVECQLIEQYYKRKANKRRLRHNPFRGSIIPPICWRREPCQKLVAPQSSSSSSSSSIVASNILSTMSNLQERMNQMGLSSDKLRDMPMEDHTSFLSQSFFASTQSHAAT